MKQERDLSAPISTRRLSLPLPLNRGMKIKVLLSETLRLNEVRTCVFAAFLFWGNCIEGERLVNMPRTDHRTP